MAKKLIGYYRPNLTGKETPEEKEKIMRGYEKFLIKQIIDNTDGYFGEFDEEEIDNILDEESRKL